MNRITIILCMLASLITLNGNATAQQHAVRVLIPFDFSVAGAHLPAGAYTIATQNGLTSITKNDSRKSTYVKTIPVFDNEANDSKVVFSSYGDQRFLRKILCPHLNMSVELAPSKPEIDARRRTASSPGN